METAHRIVEAGSSLMPASAVPPHALPGVIVRRFAFLLAFLWLASGVTHCLRWTGSSIIGGAELEELSPGTPVATNWPQPAQLFEVDALHCHGPALLVQNRFGLFTGDLHGNSSASNIAYTALQEAPAFTDDGAPVSAVSGCPASGPCDILVRSATQEQGHLVDFDVLQIASGDWKVHVEDRPSKVRLPASWRRLTVHRPNNSSRDKLQVVGWDGSEVFFASVRQGDDRAKPRFVLRPERACTNRLSRWPKVSAVLGRRCVDGPENYKDVQALQFLADGSLLLVLHGKGFLDAWRPTTGQLVGRWRLHKPQAPEASFAAGVCIQEFQESYAPSKLQEEPHRQLVIAWRMQRSAPRLEILPLPHLLNRAGCQDAAGMNNLNKLII
ncbi:unnamed protein product [Symbiodinium pilosum]|uniref:Uncharacterized protein n=1 Tax=Symbiodinium pilosum TaxID=2952 RepID=A0A812SJ91_SYMPI|nr:unnamed protein product [Symbiodinium pilosum]